MKKKTVNAFTLVEMLIVIVIIGILIAALMPRMQAAQGRARDVSRKTALSQIQSAIVVSQGDFGERPGVSGGKAGDGMSVGDLTGKLLQAGMNGIPVDPLKNKDWDGLGNFTGDTQGNYGYIVTKRNGSNEGGFVLMAKTEVPGGSNRVFCNKTSGLTGGYITSGTDIKDINLCQTIEKDPNNTSCTSNATTCYYTGEDQLRYIVIY